MGVFSFFFHIEGEGSHSSACPTSHILAEDAASALRSPRSRHCPYSLPSCFSAYLELMPQRCADLMFMRPHTKERPQAGSYGARALNSVSASFWRWDTQQAISFSGPCLLLVCPLGKLHEGRDHARHRSPSWVCWRKPPFTIHQMP